MSGIYPDIDISPIGGGQSISRRHADVSRKGGSWRIRDLGSTLGTLVNGQPLGASPLELAEGDAITFGEVTLRFSLKSPWPDGLQSDWGDYSRPFSTETQPAAGLPLLAGLPEGLRSGQLQLHYQPQVTLATGQVDSFEGLIRWTHPEKGLVEPDRFITLAEDSGFIRVLTTFAASQAAIAIRRWRKSGSDAKVGVNLSILDLEDLSFGDRLMETLGDDARPEDLVLEITERGVMFNPGVAIAMLAHLRSLGFQIAIDDYGTGQSSLAYLRDLPADEMKLDKAFTADMSSREEAIIGASVQMAHDLGMTVVAEGVEDEDTARRVRELGCDKAQGYFFGKPVPEADLDLSTRPHV